VNAGFVRDVALNKALGFDSSSPLPVPSTGLPSDDRWDAIIIGAGPAGSAAAIACARLGCKTLLLEAKSFPRRKVCGGCMNLVSLRHLRCLVGEGHRVWGDAEAVSSYHLMHRGQRFRYDLPGGLAIDRETLDQALVDVAMASGVTFCDAVTASVEGEGGSGIRVGLSVQNRLLATFEAGSVVVAGGLACKALKEMPGLQGRPTLNSRVGIAATLQAAPSELSEPGIYMAVGDEGYVGLTHIAGGRLHLAAAVDRTALQQYGPQPLVARLLMAAGAPDLDLASAQGWRGTPPLTARPERVAEKRVFLVGDAAGYVEPFTGEGLRWALSSGMQVANYVRRNQVEAASLVALDWERWYRSNIRRSQRRCRGIAWGLRSKGLRWVTHRLLSWKPGLAMPIIHGLNH
jgi:menaquinone-9 beta-reductase